MPEYDWMWWGLLTNQNHIYVEVHRGMHRSTRRCAEVCRGVQRYAEVCRGMQRYAEVHGGMQRYAEVHEIVKCQDMIGHVGDS